MAIALSACATTRSDKPVLTARAVATITKQCGAIRGKLERDRGPKLLPWAVFTINDAIDGPAGRCIAETMSAYRHQMISFDNDKPHD